MYHSSMIFNFYGQYLEKEKARFVTAQKEDLKTVCEYLKTNLENCSDIILKVFDVQKEKQQVDPQHSISRASARFKEKTIYRVWQPNEDPHFPHEITHLVAHTWGEPYMLTTELDTVSSEKISRTLEMISTSFMQEGLAIAVDDLVFTRPLLENGVEKRINDWCRKQLAKLPIPLEQVINLDGFGSFDNNLVMPFAGSLSKYLLETFSLAKYKSMYCQLSENISPDKNLSAIEEVYGLSEEAILSGWKKTIE